MIFKKLALCAFVAVFALQASAQNNVSITGTVIDGSGNGVDSASVSLMNDGSSATTDVNGAFTLGSTAVRSFANTAKAAAPVIEGNSVKFAFVNQSSVKIDLYAMNGRCALAAFNKVLGGGEYSFTPAASGLMPGIYLVKIQVGSSITMCKMPVYGRSSVPAGLRVLANSTSRGLSKKLDAVDTLIVTKIGFKTFKKGVASYTLTGQICPLTAITRSTETSIYSERVTKSIDWANTSVQVWEYSAATAAGLTSTGLVGGSTVNPYTGNTKCWLVSPGTVGWSTWGFVATNAPIDMSGFYGGDIHFYIRGTTPSIGAFVGWSNGSATTVDLSTVGYTADGAWHEITIPLTSFGAIDLSKISDYLMFVAPVSKGGAYDATSSYALDDITFQPGK
jgi:hypothetical protein